MTASKTVTNLLTKFTKFGDKIYTLLSKFYNIILPLIVQIMTPQHADFYLVCQASSLLTKHRVFFRFHHASDLHDIANFCHVAKTVARHLKWRLVRCVINLDYFIAYS